ARYRSKRNPLCRRCISESTKSRKIRGSLTPTCPITWCRSSCAAWKPSPRSATRARRRFLTTWSQHSPRERFVRSSFHYRPAKRRKIWYVGAGILVLLLALLAVRTVRNLLRHGAPSAQSVGIPPLSQGKYLALLPFRVIGDKSALGYVSDGLVEATAAKL